MNVIYTKQELTSRQGKSRWEWINALSDDNIQKTAEEEEWMKVPLSQIDRSRIHRRFSELGLFFYGESLADRVIDHLKKNPGSVPITSDEIMALTRGE